MLGYAARHFSFFILQIVLRRNGHVTSNQTLVKLMSVASVCNNAQTIEGAFHGNPSECALMNSASELGCLDLRQSYRRVEEWPDRKSVV